jgi:hypothetical protein
MFADRHWYVHVPRDLPQEEAVIDSRVLEGVSNCQTPYQDVSPILQLTPPH